MLPSFASRWLSHPRQSRQFQTSAFATLARDSEIWIVTGRPGRESMNWLERPGPTAPVGGFPAPRVVS
jgi:hypothetical protein